MIFRSKEVLARSAIPNTLRFAIVTSFTGLNILLGLLCLFAAVEGVMEIAAWSLLACVVIDGMDGSLARHWNVQSPFGTQLDSLADMTSFTIAGAVLAFFWFESTISFTLIFSASCLFVLMGAIRLARFNVSLPSSLYFQGMPTTVVGAVVAITYLAYPQLDSFWGVALVVLLAILMVSSFPYPKFRQARKFPPLVWIAILCGIVINLPWTLMLLAIFYILTGPSIWAYRRYIVR